MQTNLVTPNKFLYNKLEIDLDIVSVEKLFHYTAIEYYLTVEDEPPSNATNLTKVNRYLESFNHLYEVEDWNRASEIIFFPLNTPTQEEFHNQLGTWGYYKEQIDLCSKLLNKLTPKLNSTLLYGIGNALFAVGSYQEAFDYYQQSMEIDEKIGNRLGVGMCLGGIGAIYYCQGDYKQAINYHQRHLQTAKEVNDIQGEAYANGNLGNIYHHMGE